MSEQECHPLGFPEGPWAGASLAVLALPYPSLPTLLPRPTAMQCPEGGAGDRRGLGHAGRAEACAARLSPAWKGPAGARRPWAPYPKGRGFCASPGACAAPACGETLSGDSRKGPSDSRPWDAASRILTRREGGEAAGGGSPVWPKKLRSPSCLKHPRTGCFCKP